MAVTGAETAAVYLSQSAEVRPAGVAYTHQTMGYQTVNLGFGMELMAGSLAPNRTYSSGASDRVDLMGNIMQYFGMPMTTPTGADCDVAHVTRLGHAKPNPFNPATEIGYSLAVGAHVALRVYDVAGRLVRTLVDETREAGPHAVTWNGTTDTGARAASGVYFVRMEADGADDGFAATRKLVLLK